jgi:hypothetical protein
VNGPECFTELKPVACFDGPATGCRSLYDPISRLCRRAAMLITPGHPVCRSFAVSRLGSFMPQISPIACFRVLPGQTGSPFDVTAGLLPIDLLLSKLRVVSRRLVRHLPDFRLMPSISASLPAFADPSAGLPIPGARRSLTVYPFDCGADLRRLRNTQVFDFAFVFESAVWPAARAACHRISAQFSELH